MFWQRRAESRPVERPVPAAVRDEGWRHVPTLQRVIGPIAPIAPREPFVASLSTHRKFGFVEPLAHLIDPRAPGGSIGGLVEPASPVVQLIADDRPHVLRKFFAAPARVTQMITPAVPAAVQRSSEAARAVGDAGAPVRDLQTSAPPSPVTAPPRAALSGGEPVAPAADVLPVQPPTVPVSPSGSDLLTVVPGPRAVARQLDPVAVQRAELERLPRLPASAPVRTPAPSTDTATAPAPAEAEFASAADAAPRVQRTVVRDVAVEDTPAADLDVPRGLERHALLDRSEPTLVLPAGGTRALPGPSATSASRPAVQRAAEEASPAAHTPQHTAPPPEPAVLPVAPLQRAVSEPVAPTITGGVSRSGAATDVEAAPAAVAAPITLREGRPVGALPVQRDAAPMERASAPPAAAEDAPTAPVRSATGPVIGEGPTAAPPVVQRAVGTADQRPDQDPLPPLSREHLHTNQPMPAVVPAHADAPARHVQRAVTQLPHEDAPDAGLQLNLAGSRPAPVIQRDTARSGFGAPLRAVPRGATTPEPARPATGAPSVQRAEPQPEALHSVSVQPVATQPLPTEPVVAAPRARSLPGATVQAWSRARSADPAPPSVQRLVGSAAAAPIGARTGFGPPLPARPATASEPVKHVQTLAAGASPPSARPLHPDRDRDAGSAAVDAGVAQRAADGSVVFGDLAQAPLQRAVDPAEAPAPPEAAPVPASGAAAAVGGGLAGAPNIDDLVRRLYDPLAARLKAELRLDRERAGLVTDLWR